MCASYSAPPGPDMNAAGQCMRYDCGMTITPELDKQHEIIESGKAEVLQEFIDWLGENHMLIHEWKTGLVDWSPCDGPAPWKPCPGEGCAACGGAGGKAYPIKDRYLPITRGPEQLMADFFGIDRNRIEQERRAILASLRA